MKNIKNKTKLLKYIDGFICGDNEFKMPKFSEIARDSKIFNYEIKNLIFILKKRTINFRDEMKIDEIILNTYFSSIKVKARINDLNKNFYKETNNMSIQKPIFKKQKSIYKDI